MIYFKSMFLKHELVLVAISSDEFKIDAIHESHFVIAGFSRKIY